MGQFRYGSYGPWSNFGATGPATEGAAGLAYQTGYLGGPPVMAEIPYTDYTSGEHTVFAVMAALMHRLRTGQGQFVDISQTQATSSTIPEVLMDFSANGRTNPRLGNQDTVMSPHGCYPCQGDDRWITIAVATDTEWQAVCRVLEQGGWATDPRFEDSLSRWKNRDDLDALIGPVTSSWDPHELMHALQKEGVAAGAVLDSKDLLFDPHLGERNFYEVVTHHDSTGIPPLPYASRPWKLSKTPAVKSQPAPLMGEHNTLVLSDLLGKTAEEMTALEEARLAIQAAKENTGLAVIATMVFDKGPRGFFTMMGVTPEQAVEGLLDAGADVVGSNCGNGIDIMLEVATAMREVTSAPLLIHSNAGIPTLQKGEIVYPESSEFMADRFKALAEMGVNIVGGCCGTGPEHIRALKTSVASLVRP